jgi:hypothetical protein
VNLISISLFVTVGAMGLSVLLALLFGALSGGRGGGGSKFMLDMMNILGYLAAFTLLGGLIVRIVGSAFIITTPGKNGELAFGIASVSTAAIAAVMLLLLLLKFFDSPFGYGGLFAWILSVIEHNLFAGIGEGGGRGGGVPIESFAIYVLPIMEVAWLVLFALYEWAVGKSNKDRNLRSQGMLMVIVAPSVCGGMGLVFWLLQKIEIHSAFVPMLFVAMYLLVVGGMLFWYNLVTMGTKGTLQSAK